jgi:hypothetical protein
MSSSVDGWQGSFSLFYDVGKERNMEKPLAWFTTFQNG